MPQILILVLTLGLMYAFILVPQQRRQKAAAAMLAALKEGDEVILSAGIHGFVAEIDDDVIWLEVDPDSGTVLRVSRSAIGAVVSSADSADDDSAQASAEKSSGEDAE